MIIGGGATKEGDIYESLWAAVRMLDILSGRARSIRIEEPGVPGMEFHVLHDDGHRVYWQCKEVGGSSTGWTMASLKQRDVLANINARLNVEGDEVVFATDTSAKDLFRLEDEAKRIRHFMRYEIEMLPQGGRSEVFDHLVEVWKVERAEVFSRLLRLTVQTAGKRFLREQLIDRIGYRYDGNSETILNILQALYLESSLMEFDQGGLQAHLAKRDIRSITPVTTSAIQEAIRQKTTAFVGLQKNLFINRQLVLRPEMEKLLAELKSRTGSHDVLLTGPAGGGKSAALLDVIKFYESQEAVVLALRMDSITALELPELFTSYGTTGTPARALVNAFPGQATVIVIDQVDAVSSLSGRMPGMKDELDRLISDARGARSDGHIVHIVMACREVDLRHDHRLQALQSEKTVKAKFEKLSLEEVRSILTQIPSQHHAPTGPELEILRTPLNLRLYCDIGRDGSSSSFSTVHDLFAAYWEHKRAQVQISAATEDNWLSAISLLVNSMNGGEELSVPMEVLDLLPLAYRNALITEAVVVVENSRVRFSHERFLDFCVARLALSGNLDPLTSLLNSNQDLFWRAQVRQVLTSLRESGSTAYLSYLGGLLQHKAVRPHIKALTIEVLFSFSRPSVDEVTIGLPMVERGLLRSCGVSTNGDWTDECAWESFFGSKTWLHAASETGAIDGWIESGDSRVVQRLCHYLNRQAAANGDRVAELLTRWDRRGRLNDEQLRASVFMADLDHSDRFFATVIQWIHDGKLDGLGDHGFDMDLQKRNPSKAVRLYAAVFERWIRVVDNHGRVSGDREFRLLQAMSGDQVMESSNGAPVEFVSAVLPHVLELSVKTSFGGDGLLRPDMTWAIRWERESHPSVPWAFVFGCENALSLIADHRVRDLWLTKLMATRTATANDILCNLFIAHPEHYASKALELVVLEPVRLDSGPSGAHMWYGHEILRLCSVHVNDALFGQVENLALDYTRRDGERVDFDHWVLASALPASRVSQKTTALIEEWQPRFGKKRIEPRESIIVGVYSPVPEKIAAQYTDEEWIAAMRSNASDDVHDWEEPGKGGATELARLLEGFAKASADRFYRLLQLLPEGLNPTFRFHLLLGLGASELSVPEKVDLVFAAFRFRDRDCDRRALGLLRDLIGKHELTEAQFDVLLQFAREEANEDASKGWGEKPSEQLLNHGINTIPGSAIICVGLAMLHQHEFDAKGVELAKHLIEAGSSSLLACALAIPCQLSGSNPTEAVDLFLEVLNKDLELVSTSYGDRFFHWALHNHYERTEHILGQMLDHTSIELHKDCGRHSALVALYFQGQTAHVERAFSVDEFARQGIAAVANANLAEVKNRDQCEDWLVRLFLDPSKEVRIKAARCFYANDETDGRVALFMPRLVSAFLASEAFQTDPTPLLDALDRHTPVLPPVALDVCERYLLSETKTDTPGDVQRDHYLVSDLVLKCYHLFTDRDSRMRVLNLLDALAKAGHRGTVQELSKFDR